MPDSAQSVTPHERFLKVNEVADMLGDVSRPSVYKLMKENSFPHPYKVTRGRVAWSLHEVLLWIERRKAEQRAA